MKLTNLFASEENRAVSPVIGVILMVAITVILAAVIGAFVLGLGGDQEESPQVTLNLECDGDFVEDVNHRGGDTLDGTEIADRGDFDTDPLGDSGETASAGQSLGDEFDNFDPDGTTQEAVTIVHTPSDSILLDRSC